MMIKANAPTGLVIGAGPAGLMAAEVMAIAGLKVTVCEAKPTPARKFLMAGKSGLNLTFEGDAAKLLAGYNERSAFLEPALAAFDNNALRSWAERLGQETFAGSTGRVFPKAMKASPLLRAWLARLDSLGVTLNTRWRATGWNERSISFETPNGNTLLTADSVVLACGGASWPRLGSDGQWADWIGAEVNPFAPSNAGLRINWSERMEPLLGRPVKAVAWTAGPITSRGEATIAAMGLEGGGVYPLGPALREGNTLTIDLLPDRPLNTIVERLSRRREKDSFGNFLRKSLKLDPVKIALLNEWGRPLPKQPGPLASLLKALPVPITGLMPLGGAISSVGGVSFDALDDHLMLSGRPGVFCAGEMIDWDAPTGGWLLTACFATGAWAGHHAANYAFNASRPASQAE